MRNRFTGERSTVKAGPTIFGPAIEFW